MKPLSADRASSEWFGILIGGRQQKSGIIFSD
jgi:hypothetical protein